MYVGRANGLLSDVERRRGLEMGSRSVCCRFLKNRESFVETHLDAVPVLAGEGVLGLLLKTLLALGQSLVPARQHQWLAAALLVLWIMILRFRDSDRAMLSIDNSRPELVIAIRDRMTPARTAHYSIPSPVSSWHRFWQYFGVTTYLPTAILTSTCA